MRLILIELKLYIYLYKKSYWKIKQKCNTFLLSLRMCILVKELDLKATKIY